MEKGIGEIGIRINISFPFPAILKEAGGYFGDWQGNSTIHGNEAMATSQQLLPEVLALIRG